MGRLIGFLLVFAIFLVFIGMNLDNKCDISFGFYTFIEAPVYITAFVSFLIGMICAIPLIAFVKRKKSSSKDTIEPQESKKKNKKSATAIDQIPGENGPYGID
jgi:uncharacterized membrane protein YciS (DUF1049 family)